MFVLLAVVAVALLLWGTRFSLGPTDEELEDLEEAIATALGPEDLMPDTRLRTVVESVLLPGMDKTSCEWGSSTVSSDPKSWHGCWDYVPGSLVRVASRVDARLDSEGFRVRRARTGHTIELTAVRKSDTVCVDVLAPGFTDGRNTSPAEINPDAGEVFVDVWTAERRNEAQDACAELPPWDGQ